MLRYADGGDQAGSFPPGMVIATGITALRSSRLGQILATGGGPTGGPALPHACAAHRPWSASGQTTSCNRCASIIAGFKMSDTKDTELANMHAELPHPRTARDKYRLGRAALRTPQFDHVQRLGVVRSQWARSRYARFWGAGRCVAGSASRVAAGT